MSSSNGKDNSGPARERYWKKHDKPTHGITKKLGYVRRVRRMSILQTIHDLGNASDVAVLRNRPEGLYLNRAFNEHQQKLNGAISRFRKRRAWSSLPYRVENLALASAFKRVEERK